MAMLFFAGRVLLLVSAAAVAVTEPDLDGRWQVPSKDSALPSAIVRFEQVNGEYRGVIASIPGAQGKDDELRCTACTGSRRNQPLLKMEIIWGLKRRGLEYTGGSVLDPETGETYRCSLTLAPSGQELRIRYSVDSQHESVSETWIRDAQPRDVRGRSG